MERIAWCETEGESGLGEDIERERVREGAEEVREGAEEVGTAWALFRGLPWSRGDLDGGRLFMAM